MKPTSAKWLPHDGLFPGGPANAAESAQLASTSRSRLRFQRPHTQQSTAITVCKSFFSQFFFFFLRIHPDLGLVAAIMVPDPEVNPRAKRVIFKHQPQPPQTWIFKWVVSSRWTWGGKRSSAGVDDARGTTCILEDSRRCFTRQTAHWSETLSLPCPSLIAVTWMCWF